MAERFTVVPLTPLRKIIAARMTDAARTIPHFRLVADIDMDATLGLRRKLNAELSANTISVNACIVKACAAALVEHPAINSQMMGNEIHQYRQADISVIIAVEGGLFSPVIRQANQKSVRDIAIEIQALAARAAEGRLRMEEILGGSFSVSNLGGHGVDQFDAIINPPQCAILAVGRARPRVIVCGSGETRIANILRATLSVDHRAIDGAMAAAFMNTLRVTLEQPQRLFAAGTDGG